MWNFLDYSTLVEMLNIVAKTGLFFLSWLELIFVKTPCVQKKNDLLRKDETRRLRLRIYSLRKKWLYAEVAIKIIESLSWN